MDNYKRLVTLKKWRDYGKTLILVEHDDDTMDDLSRTADICGL